MAKISKSISINAPVAQVFDYVNDPRHLPEIWPSMVEVSHVKTAPDGAHSFDWIYKMAGIRFKGHAETIEAERNKRVVTKNEKGIPSTFLWTYEGEDSTTKLMLEIDYTLPGKLLDKLAAPFVTKVNDREAETVLENLKTRMETGQFAAAGKSEVEQAGRIADLGPPLR